MKLQKDLHPTLQQGRILPRVYNVVDRSPKAADATVVSEITLDKDLGPTDKMPGLSAPPFRFRHKLLASLLGQWSVLRTRTTVMYNTSPQKDVWRS